MKFRITIELNPDDYKAMKSYLAEVGIKDSPEEITRQDVADELKNVMNWYTYRAITKAIDYHYE